jgi:hypothetical protein
MWQTPFSDFVRNSTEVSLCRYVRSIIFDENILYYQQVF